MMTGSFAVVDSAVLEARKKVRAAGYDPLNLPDISQASSGVEVGRHELSQFCHLALSAERSREMTARIVQLKGRSLACRANITMLFGAVVKSIFEEMCVS